MNKIYLLIQILLLAFLSRAQINANGYPFYTYYDSKDYNAYDQNWDVVEDNNGIIYVANNHDGILQFDGVTWRKIEIENKLEVRTLAINDDGIIYVGCFNDFGYLSISNTGKKIYKSLLKRFAIEKKDFSIIYNVNIIEDTVFFSTDNSILYQYNIVEDTLLQMNLPQYNLFTHEFNQNIVGSSVLDGLYEKYNDTVRTILGGDFYKNKNIFSILPDSNITHIVTGQQGIYSYNYNNGKSKQLLSNKSANFLSNYISYSATKTKNNILLATIGSGVVGCNMEGQITDVLDENIGIEDHTCASIDSYRNSMWCALGIGIVRFEYNSPFHYFSKESDLEGFIVDVIEFKGKLFIATELGLYYLKQDNNEQPKFVKIIGIDNYIRSMCKMSHDNEELLLIGTGDGIYQIENCFDKPKSVEKNAIGIEKLFNTNMDKIENQDRNTSLYVNDIVAQCNSNRVWIGTKSRLVCFEREKGQWFVSDHIFENIGEVDIVEEDMYGNIWAATMQNGLVKVEINESKLVKFGLNSGLPTLFSLRPYNFGDKLACGTPEGLFLYDYLNKTFIKDTLFPEKFSNGNFGVWKMIQSKSNDVYISYYSDDVKYIDKLAWSKANSNYSIVNDFKRIGDVEVTCFYESENLIWMGISDVLYNYDFSMQVDINMPYKCLVRKVEGVDSAYFFGTYVKETERGFLPSNIQNEKHKPIIDYSNNDLTFYFAAPYYEGADAIKYSYKLTGFKKEWSKWNEEPKAVFTNLNEGKYTFQVKAKNIYEIESSVGKYSFTILPPWYRTVFAYFIYFICFIFVIWIILKLYTRRLKRDKIRLEAIVRERTAEIREQRDEIAGQKKSIEDSIQYASRIQRAILPSVELSNEILPEHFILFRPRDIVSGDYYWMNKIGDKTILVAADCTGHGVPGAFMSMLGVSFLNAIVLKEQEKEPHIILNKLRERVKKTLKQEGKEGEAKDGMDIAIVVIDETQRKLYFAGAYNPVLIYRNNELHEIKADRMPIGIYIREKDSFTLHEFDYQKGDTFYIFSDGYPDQFGGEKGQKFRIKTMKQLFLDIQGSSMQEQKEILDKTILDWMGQEHEQIDDMVIVGVRL